MEFRYQRPPGWPRLLQGWHPWWEECPRLVAVGIALDVAVFLTVWLATLGFARLDLTMFGAKTTAAWFWLWIAGAGMGLTGAIVSASPERRSFGRGILLGLPLPVLLAYFLTA
jgi:hypothetical protein